MYQDYVKVREEGRDGSVGHKLSKTLMSEQGMPSRVQDKHLEKAQTEEL